MNAGEYEETIARSWHRSTNLRTFFGKQSCPPAIEVCYGIFEKLVKPQARGTLTMDSVEGGDNESIDPDAMLAYDEFPGREETISDNVRSAFLNRGLTVWKAKSPARVRRNGISFSTEQSHEGNSGVFLKNHSVPFCIKKIHCLPSKGTWLVAQRYRRADVMLDPYIAYPHLRASMWATELTSSLEVFSIDEIDTHFAKRDISWEGKRVTVIFSLARVSFGDSLNH